MRRFKLREVATVFVGNCPACDDTPDGKWFDGSEFEHYCGYTLVVSLHKTRDAEHWRFDFAFTDEAARFRRARPGRGGERR